MNNFSYFDLYLCNPKPLILTYCDNNSTPNQLFP